MPETKKTMIGKAIKPVPRPEPEIGIDSAKDFSETIIEAADVGKLDIGAVESFTSVAQSRDLIYNNIDTMGQDSLVASVLETYAEDITAPNDDDQIIWAESNDPDVQDYANHLINVLDIEDNIPQWALALVKYGDIYVKLYKESEIEQEYSDIEKSNNGKEININQKSLKEQIELYKNDPQKLEQLKEAVRIQVNSKNDKFTHFIEMEKNPAEIFELIKNGKTAAFIKAPITSVTPRQFTATPMLASFNYKMKPKDVDILPPDSYVHAFLPDTSSRTDEIVNLFYTDDDYTKETNQHDFKVRRGSSILANAFKIWRQYTLLKNSILLSRITKSAIVRILNINTGDMPPNGTSDFIARLKSKIEQKSAINTDIGMAEYVNPGPIENIIYIPTHNEQGTITAQTIGGDYDPKNLTDLEAFRDELFGALRVPKQYFGFTGDGAGFNGGASLSIISSRYAKTVIKNQKALCRLVTNILNILFLDKGLETYVNNFKVRMQKPVTQEDIDKRTNNDTKIRFVTDVANLLSSDVSKKALLEIKKQMLTPIINNVEVTKILEEEIAAMSGEETPKESEQKEEKTSGSSGGSLPPFRQRRPERQTEPEQAPAEETTETEIISEPTEEIDSYMPSPSDLGISMVDNQ